MSLINDALKKAQRQRATGANPGASDTPANGSALAKRARPLSARSVVLIAGGALVLVMAAVTATIFFVTDTPPPPPARPRVSPVKSAKPTSMPAIETAPVSVVAAPDTTEAPAQPTAPAATTTPATTAVVKLPEYPAPSATTAATSSSPAAVTGASSPSIQSPPPSAATTPPRVADGMPAPAAAVPASSAPAAAVTFTIPKPDERINAFIDRLRVTGIRSSGADSKVLMNDRVYRVNDIVDRSLGLKLVKVAPDTLTFEDANGLTYTKNF